MNHEHVDCRIIGVVKGALDSEVLKWRNGRCGSRADSLKQIFGTVKDASSPTTKRNRATCVSIWRVKARDVHQRHHASEVGVTACFHPWRNHVCKVWQMQLDKDSSMTKAKISLLIRH